MSISISISDDYEGLSRLAADRILAALARQPKLLLCAAGGSSPARTYELLAAAHQRDPASFRTLRLVKLDEWAGLGPDDPGSCTAQLRAALIEPLALSEERCFGFRGEAVPSETECERIHERLAAEGPIDVCVLGLGLNGHIAMNEPAASLQPFSHVARLSEESLRHPMLAQTKTKPAHGLTLGMAEILASREIRLLVSGAGKRAALQRLLRREITTAFPASFLWLHPNCTVLCDRAAAAGGETGS